MRYVFIGVFPDFLDTLYVILIWPKFKLQRILISDCPRDSEFPDNFVSDPLVSAVKFLQQHTLVITNTKLSGISQSLGQLYLIIHTSPFSIKSQ
jgi:hypothetical protein